MTSLLAHRWKLVLPALVVLIALCAFPRIKRHQDEKTFATIVSFWHAAFPGSTFEGARLRFVNGPRGSRECIPVPKEIESLYSYPFSVAFLDAYLHDERPLESALANDLLDLQRHRLLGRHEMRLSYGPDESAKKLECYGYVVDVEQDRPLPGVDLVKRISQRLIP